MNEIQFIGSHNSYKQQMPSLYFWLLRLIDGEGAKALEYWHPPIADQLELGLRKLELDFFMRPFPESFLSDISRSLIWRPAVHP